MALGALLVTAGCEKTHGPDGRWPAVEPQCRGVRIFLADAPPPFSVFAIRELQGSSREQNKNLRVWIVNKACFLGANVVVDVVETRSETPAGPMWHIHGVAAVSR